MAVADLPVADGRLGYDVSDYATSTPPSARSPTSIEQCHARDMRMLLDWVPNHTSDRHPWFEASRSSRDDPQRDWYVWRDGKAPEEPPNDWTSQFRAVGPAWTFDEPTGQWYLHSFMAEQPDLNWDNPEVEAAMHDVIRFWLDREVDGAHNFVFVDLPWDAEAFRTSIDDFEALADARRGRRGSSRTTTSRARRRASTGMDSAPLVRAPMPWRPPSAAGPAAGFGGAEPWLPTVGDAERLNAETQAAGEGSTLNLVRRLAALRARTPALQVGGQRTFAPGQGVILRCR